MYLHHIRPLIINPITTFVTLSLLLLLLGDVRPADAVGVVDDYVCKPTLLLPISNLTYVEAPFKINNYFLSTNVDSPSLMIRVYPLLSSPQPQHTKIAVSFEFCPDNRDTSEYYVEVSSMSYATVYIPNAQPGDYLINTESSGSYAIQACTHNCTPLCSNECTGNGYCDVNAVKCVCGIKWGGSACQVYCGNHDTCDETPKPPVFPFFGNLAITILLIGVIPCLAITGIITAIVAYCGKAAAEKKKDRTQPIMIYQSLPSYDKLGK